MIHSKVIGESLTLYSGSKIEKFESKLGKTFEEEGFYRVYTPHICLEALTKKLKPLLYNEFYPPIRQKGEVYLFGVPKNLLHVVIASSVPQTIKTLPVKLYEFSPKYNFEEGVPKNCPSAFFTIIAANPCKIEVSLRPFCLWEGFLPQDAIEYKGSDNSKHPCWAACGTIWKRKQMSIDKQRGCMYGLAIGDALGAAVEFRAPGTFEPVTGYRDGGPHDLDAGEWTDDTSMALALADSLARGWDAKDQLTRYLDWYQNGAYSVNGRCFDIGTTTRTSLWDFESNGTLEASDDEAFSGNGSIMRLAPIPIKYFNDKALPFYADRSSVSTHGSRACRSACRFLGLILGELILGKTLEEALAVKAEWLYLGIEEIQKGSYKDTENINGSGYVVQSLQAAIWSVWSAKTFEESVLNAVNLGDDSDTTGAVAGQIAGALYGYDAIPKYLIDGLAKKDMIDKYLNPLLAG